MADYPTLSTLPDSVSPISDDNSIRAEANGYVMTRKRFTKTSMTYVLSYPILTAADMLLLNTHYSSNETYLIFNWVFKTVTRQVRYKTPIQTTETQDGYAVQVQLKTA